MRSRKRTKRLIILLLNSFKRFLKVWHRTIYLYQIAENETHNGYEIS